MLELKIERDDVNVELLDAQLRTVASDLFLGLSTQRGAVVLYLSDAASADVQKTLGRIARQHDAAQLTPRQEAQASREKVLEGGRTHTPLDTSRYAESPALIQMLAAKIAWLEEEIRDLRSLS